MKKKLTIEELGEKWVEKKFFTSSTSMNDPQSFEKVIKSRIRKHTGVAFQYFWASFVLQIIIYSLLCHVTIKYWSDSEVRIVALGAILLYLPFAIILMRKFKKLAILKISRDVDTVLSLYGNVAQQKVQLDQFYAFKKKYEALLIPLSSAAGVFIIYKLYVPGGIAGHWISSVIIFMAAIVSCFLVIRKENDRNFKKPIEQLQIILDEFSSES